VLLELADQLRGAVVAGGEDDEGLDELAALGVGLPIEPGRTSRRRRLATRLTVSVWP
jgi:hypothetical protein